MTQGEAEPTTARSGQVAAALVEVALQLGGSWTLVISPDGQLQLAETDVEEAPF